MARPHLRDPGKERFWRRVVGRWRNSGLTIRDFCAAEGVAEPSFYHWRRELEYRDREKVPVRPMSVARATSTARVTRRAQQETPVPSAAPATPAFLPVRLLAENLSPIRAPIEVVLNAGRRVRVGPGFDRQTLRDVLAVLEEPASERGTDAEGRPC